jgi:hypothetical protein
VTSTGLYKVDPEVAGQFTSKSLAKQPCQVTKVAVSSVQAATGSMVTKMREDNVNVPVWCCTAVLGLRREHL